MVNLTIIINRTVLPSTVIIWKNEKKKKQKKQEDNGGSVVLTWANRFTCLILKFQKTRHVKNDMTILNKQPQAYKFSSLSKNWDL